MPKSEALNKRIDDLHQRIQMALPHPPAPTFPEWDTAAISTEAVALLERDATGTGAAPMMLISGQPNPQYVANVIGILEQLSVLQEEQE